MMQNQVEMKNIAFVILLSLSGVFSGSLMGQVIQLPAGWYPNFPITNWQESRTNVIQTLNGQGISFTRNVADELVWNSTVTTYPTETDLLFSQSNLLERVTVYVHELTDATTRHAQWFSLFSAEYGNDYQEENTAEIHKYKWPNENNMVVELILFKQNPNFAIRAEFSHP
jgi:uncharacterized protein YbdZ (MbtH family)